MRCVVLAVILSASLCAALPLKFLATGGPCEAAGGKCGNPDACSPAVGGLIYGQCPGTDVCCLPKAAAPGCTKLNGKCDDKSRASTTCAGSWVTGQCPGKYVCCAPSGAAQQQQQPGLAQKPAPGPAVVDTPRPIQTNTGPGPIVSGAKLLCMSFDDGPFISSATDVSKRLATAMYEAGVPATFYVNCHREMADSDRTAWLDQLKKQKHSIGNHMCEHDIMAQSHYTAKYGSYMRQPDGCLTQPGQQAIFRTHLMDNYNLWQKYGVEMKTARLNGDGRFNPCVVKHTENAILPDTKAHKHVTWQYEVGPTMKKDVPTSYVMGHLKTSTGVSLDGFTLNSDPPGNPVSKRPMIVLAHDLHYKDSTKVQLLQNWVKKMSSLGYSWGKINDQGECVPQ